jgi:hypothetical protein
MIFKLVSIYYKGTGGLPLVRSLMGGGKKRKKGKSIMLAILTIYLLIVYFCMLGSSFYNQLVLSPFMAFLSALAMAFVFGVMFSYTSVYSILVTAADLNFLQPLPLTEKEITWSRFVVLYLELLAEAAIVYVPFFGVCLLKADFSFLWYLSAFLCFLLIPLAGTAFLSIFAYLGSRSRSLSKANIYLVYILSFLAVFYMMKNGISTEAMERMFSTINDGRVSLFGLGAKAMETTALLVAATVVLLVFARFSSRLKGNGGKEKSVNVKGDVYASKSVLKTLTVRELRVLKSNSAFVSELVMEQVIPVMLAVVYVIIGVAGDMLSILYEESVAPYRLLIVTAVLLLFYSFSLVSATSVSREGRDYDLMRTLPFDAKSRVDSKILFHLAFTYPFAVPLMIIALALTGSPVLFIVLAALMMVSFIPLISVIGLMIDFGNPRLDWSTGQEAVKQNVNGLFGLLFGFTLVIISSAIGFFFIRAGVSQYVVPPVLSIIYLTVFFLLRKLTISKVAKDL